MAAKSRRNRRVAASQQTTEGPESPEARPTYNLRAVVQRTGLKPDTLRAWERRYGLPVPERTAGGHRIYSEADIHCLLWLVARQEEGMNISQAVSLWQSLAADGRQPTLDMPTITSQREELPLYKIAAGGIVDDLRRRWIEACAAFQEREAEQILSQAFALYPPEVVCIEVLQKGLGQIGNDWYRGHMTVQQEHFASELAMRRLETLLAATPDPTQDRRIAVVCPPHENHTFSPLVLTFMLRRRGWDVLYLGANLPQEKLADTVRMTHTALVVLVAQQLFTAATLMEMAETLAAENVTVAYGGQIFNLIPDLRKRIAGHFLGDDLPSAPRQVERLLLRAITPPTVTPVSPRYQSALPHFLDQQSFIDAQVWQAMAAKGMPQAHIFAAKQNFGRDLTAALTLGNLDYLGNDLNWIAGLLSYRQVPVEFLLDYLNAYYAASKRLLDERAHVIVEWFANLLGQYHTPPQNRAQVADDSRHGVA